MASALSGRLLSKERLDQAIQFHVELRSLVAQADRLFEGITS
jgi:hypothetical protein